MNEKKKVKLLSTLRHRLEVIIVIVSIGKLLLGLRVLLKVLVREPAGCTLARVVDRWQQST